MLRRILAALACIVADAPCIAQPLVRIPERCYQFQRHLIAEAHETLGLNAPVSVLGAQIMQESACKPDARSHVGASGLTQFMPATARWMAELYPRELGPADPLNPKWAISAQVRYMRDILRRNPASSECDSWAFALSGYNGGEGWLRRDQAVCSKLPLCDRGRWFGHVADTPDLRRSPAARRENRGYPHRILLTLAPAYDAAGWGRSVACPLTP